MKRKVNLADLALLLLGLSVLAALVVHVVVPSPLRRAVVDEAERVPVEIVVRSEYLPKDMTPGHAQRLQHGETGVELLAIDVKDGRVFARFRVNARKWRGFLQYGETTLTEGATFDFYGPGYQYSGVIVDAR